MRVMIESAADLPGRPLSPGEVFTFRCHPALECFNTCCRDKRLPVLPYDAMRLRRSLGIGSAELLERHVVLETDPVSGWPALRLGLADDGRCPFVGPDGCTVYEDRPTCCRIYPLARAVRPAPGGDGFEEVFLAGHTPACLGWDEPNELTVEAWVEQQGLAPYREANNRLPGLLLHRRRARPMRLDERQIHGFLLGLYNLDMLRELAARPEFGQRFGLAPAEVQAALEADEALLDLGLGWLITQFFGAG